MSKQKTSFSLDADVLLQLAELGKHFKRSKASMLEVLVDEAYLKMRHRKALAAATDKLLEKDENGFYKNPG